jgi:hypothetical protein
MDDPRSKLLGPWTLVALILGAALVVSMGVFSRGLTSVFRISHQDHRITVTGSATRRIRSDFIVWECTTRAQETTLAAAYKKLATDAPVVTQFLHDQGVADADVTVHSVEVTELHPQVRCQKPSGQEEVEEKTDTVSGYIAEQTIEVKSADVTKIDKASHDVTTLIDRGIYIRSQAPVYVYTKLADLKIHMLADASKDARQRAEQIAQNTRSRLGSLVSARMGVIQVNPEFSTEVSGEGNNDKTSLDKDVLAIVTTSFDVE